MLPYIHGQKIFLGYTCRSGILGGKRVCTFNSAQYYLVFFLIFFNHLSLLSLAYEIFFSSKSFPTVGKIRYLIYANMMSAKEMPYL